MRERDYLRLNRQIEADYSYRLEALELIWQMARSGRPVKPPRTAVQQLVRAFLNGWAGEEFSLDEVVKYIRQTAPNLAVNRTSISGVLRRLAINGELEVISQGKGNKPSRYRRRSGSDIAA
jgi:hypothetical protein